MTVVTKQLGGDDARAVAEIDAKQLLFEQVGPGHVHRVDAVCQGGHEAQRIVDHAKDEGVERPETEPGLGNDGDADEGQTEHDVLTAQLPHPQHHEDVAEQHGHCGRYGPGGSGPR